MSYFVNNQQKMYEIIFANRNKNYGAYVIRSAYGSTVFKSIAYMATSFCSLMGLLYYLSHRNDLPKTPEREIIPVLDTVIFDATPPKEKPAEPSSPSPPPTPASPNTFNNPVVTDSVPVNQPTPDLAAAQPSGATTGTADPNAPVIPGGGGSSTLTAIDTLIGDGKVPPEKFPDSFPDPGYDIREFLRTNIHYPAEAIEVGKGGTLYVRFVVDEKGKVTTPETMNRLGFGLDEEGVRVINKLPDFKKPAFKNNKPVKAYYQVPIRYKVN